MSAQLSNIRKYALLGHPVSHSLSPVIHNTAFRRLGIKAAYDLCDTEADGLEKNVERLLAEGYSGWNVTMPDKSGMCLLCDELSPAAVISGSVNTVLVREGKLFGSTTDGDGFLYAAQTLNVDLKAGRLVLLGSGGAAASMLTGAALFGTPEISVYVHSENSRYKVEKLCLAIRPYSDSRISILPLSDHQTLKRDIADAVLLANATNAGMAPNTDLSPLPEECLSEGTPVFDAIYNPRETLLLKHAKKTGCRTVNGLPMLVGQAASSFRIWTEQEMPVDFILSSLFS